MSARLWVVLLFLLIAQSSPRFFRYERPITGIPAEQKQTCVTLDVAAFAHSSDLADLRVYRDGQETPYDLRVAAPLIAGNINLRPLNLGSRNGSVVFDAEMPPGSYGTIQLDLNRQDFIASVDVSGSQAQDATSSTRLGTYTVFELTGQKLGRSMVLHLPVSDFPYLHFRIGSPVKPEDVAGLAIEQQPLLPAEYVTVAESSQISQQGRSSVIEFTLSANAPVDRVEFVPAVNASNFSRDVNIEIAPEQPPQNRPQIRSYSGEIRRVHGLHNGRRIDDERLAVGVGSGVMPTPSKWTVKIDNGDDLPLALGAVRLQMQKRDICFDANPTSNYVIFYGDAALTAPRYDYATLFQPDKNAAQATLGPEQANPQFEPRPDDRPFTEKHPALLWIALVAVIAGLGMIALRTARQVSPRS